jgi:hypothetical protein
MHMFNSVHIPAGGPAQCGMQRKLMTWYRYNILTACGYSSNPILYSCLPCMWWRQLILSYKMQYRRLFGGLHGFAAVWIHFDMRVHTDLVGG